MVTNDRKELSQARTAAEDAAATPAEKTPAAQVACRANGAAEPATGASAADEPSAAPPAASPLANQQARLQRIADYQRSSLKKTNHLEATLGSMNSGLMGLGVFLDELLQQELAVGAESGNLDCLEEILPALETHLRLARQVDRYANLELRSAAARKARPEASPGEGDSGEENTEEEAPKEAFRGRRPR